MKKLWQEEAVLLMRRHRITQREVAQKLGCSREWVNRCLNLKESPEGVEERITKAIQDLIEGKGK